MAGWTSPDRELIEWDGTIKAKNKFKGDGSSLDNIHQAFFNGTIKETFNALVTSDGATVTMTLTNASGGDLTAQFSDGPLTLIGGSTIDLTAGSDSSPTENFTYIPISTKVLTVSTSDWPSEEHVKISYFLVPSASFVQSSGVYVNQNWNDHDAGTDGQGHMSHIAERSRRDGAYYHSGIDGNGTDGYLTPTAGSTELKATAGVIYQMHKHTVPVFDTSGSDMVLVKNWDGDAFHNITDLYDITEDSTGTTIGNNKYFNLTIWAVGNKGGEFTPMMINLPSGSYNTQAGAENDTSGFDDFTIPAVFTRESSTGFLIARVTIQMKTGGGTWVVTNTQDLRGTTPQTATGGVSGITTAFADNNFTIFDETDPTKIIAFDVGTNITTGTTRTYKATDLDGTIPLLESQNIWTTTNKFTSTVNVDGTNLLTLGNSQGLAGDWSLNSDGTDGIIAKGTGAGASFDHLRIKDADVVIEQELEGSKKILQFSHGGTLALESSIKRFLKIGEVQCTATKGFVAERAGSIVGLSCNYDISGNVNDPTLLCQAEVNTSTVFTMSLDNANGTDKTAQLAQLRDVDTFSAGDILNVVLKGSGGFATADADLVICGLTIYYDT